VRHSGGQLREVGWIERLQGFFPGAFPRLTEAEPVFGASARGRFGCVEFYEPVERLPLCLRVKPAHKTA